MAPPKYRFYHVGLLLAALYLTLFGIHNSLASAELSIPVLRLEHGSKNIEYLGFVQIKSTGTPTSIKINLQTLFNAELVIKSDEEALKAAQSSAASKGIEWRQISIMPTSLPVAVKICDSWLPRPSYVVNQEMIRISVILSDGCDREAFIPVEISALVTWVDTVTLPKAQVTFEWKSIYQVAEKYITGGFVTYAQMEQLTKEELMANKIVIRSDDSGGTQELNDYIVTLLSKALLGAAQLEVVDDKAANTGGIRYRLRNETQVSTEASSYSVEGIVKIERRIYVMGESTVRRPP